MTTKREGRGKAQKKDGRNPTERPGKDLKDLEPDKGADGVRGGAKGEHIKEATIIVR